MVSVDRGAQLEALRQAEVLTDVVLVAGKVEVMAHRLVLSLHSAYFRTLFQSSGFLESGQERVLVSGLLPAHLRAIVTYLYSGRLEVTAADALELLEAAELLQLEEPGDELRRSVSAVLEVEVEQADSMQALFPLWNTAVTYSLPGLLKRVLGQMAFQLQEFAGQPKDRKWLGRLGWQELQQVLAMDNLCVQSEWVLLDLVLGWAQGEVKGPEDVSRVLELLRGVRLAELDKRLVLRALTTSLGPGVRPRRPESSEPRCCQRCLICFVHTCTLPSFRCTYVVEYKLAKSQLRNIEDFTDQGQRSQFLELGLVEGRVRPLSRLTSPGSMVASASGNHGRPATQGSRLAQQGALLAVLGGAADSAKGPRSEPRSDVLVYDPASGCWRTSLKQHLRPRPRCRLAEVVPLAGRLALIWQPMVTEEAEHSRGALRALLGTEGSGAVVELLDLGAAVDDGRVAREVVAPLPASLLDGPLAGCTLGSSLFLLGQGGGEDRAVLWSLDPESGGWEEHPPPPGRLGAGRPVIAPFPPYICLVGGRPGMADGPTNSLQLYDSEARSWRRLPDLDTRLTPLDLFTHCGRLFLVAWHPARLNFVLALKLRGEEVESEVVVSGLEGVWSRGVVFRGGFGG